MCSPHQMGLVGKRRNRPSVSPSSISRADLGADKISKCISVVMKPQEVQLSFCIGYSHKSSRSQVPFKQMNFFLPAIPMPSTQGIAEPIYLHHEVIAVSVGRKLFCWHSSQCIIPSPSSENLSLKEVLFK